MKNKTGMIGGFILELTGFLLLFKFIFLDNIPPADEVAPGIVVLASILNGLLFAFAGQRIQDSLERKGQDKQKDVSAGR